MPTLHLPYPVPYNKLDFEKQSIEVPGSNRPGQTGMCTSLARHSQSICIDLRSVFVAQLFIEMVSCFYD